MILQFSGLIDSAKANNDHTLTLKVETQELPPEDAAKIFHLFQREVWIAIAETAITKEDLHIPETVDPLEKKSPSQRLRDRMFVYFKEYAPSDDFESWYRAQLEKIGEKYLEKLA